jgi:hypothetical protein
MEAGLKKRVRIEYRREVGGWFSDFRNFELLFEN